MKRNMRALIDSVLAEALEQARAAGVSVYTFAVYYDHESPAISVCIDTVEQSLATVASINAYNSKYFHSAVSNGDLEDASLWQANIGRSLSLGDFRMVNVGRRELGADFSPHPDFFLSLVQALVAAESEVASLSATPEALILCCSGLESEVEYWWSLGSHKPNPPLQRTASGGR